MKEALLIENLDLDRAGQPVLRGVGLSVAAGERVGLIGPNGSGKSSLLRVCAGLLPCSGSLRVAGIDPRSDPLAARARFGMAVDPARLPEGLRVQQCIELVAHLRGLDADDVARAGELAGALGLSPWLDAEVATCSLGTRQKLCVVLALLGDPPLLLLDEVFNGLDPVAAWQLKTLLRERAAAGAGVLLTTHDLAGAEREFDRVILLIEGRIAAHWSRPALDALGNQPGGLEAAVVAQLQAR